MKHAIVPVGEYLVPLIGVPQDAALETCDLCGDVVPLWKVEYNGKQVLCERCRKDKNAVNQIEQ